MKFLSLIFLLFIGSLILHSCTDEDKTQALYESQNQSFIMATDTSNEYNEPDNEKD